MRDLDAIAEAVGPGPVDVLWSSFPCQPFTKAGLRRGSSDERDGWPWTTAAIDRFRPRWFLGENVRGLLMHIDGCMFAGGQGNLFAAAEPQACPGCYFERVILPDLRRRFAHVGWWIMNAADYGVPQGRRRIILWAGPAPLIKPAATHGPDTAQPWVRAEQVLDLDRTSSLGQWALMRTGSHGDGKQAIPLHGPATTVTTVAGRAPWKTAGATWLARAGECRRLTTAECAVLQDFPAGYPFQGGTGAQYRQIGNAVPPRLAEVVGRALLEAAR